MPQQNPDMARPGDSFIDQLVAPGAGVDHIAYATRQIDGTAEILGLLGFRKVIDKTPINKFGILASKLVNDRGDVIELVEPIPGEPSAVSGTLGTADCVLYHICHKVENFAATYLSLKAAGATTVTKPFESLIFSRHMSAHLYHPSLGLFEIFGLKEKPE